jgi:hypothetical protein
MVHIGCMRTSVTLDEDVYQLATLYAKGRGVTLGAAIGELIRKNQAETGTTHASTIRRSPNGLPLLSRTGRVITPQMVKDAQEDEVA